MNLSPDSPSISEEFAQAYEQFADAIFRHCAFRIYDRERGKELMQEAFMKAWKYLADGNAIDDVRPFLYKIAHNLILNEARRRKRRTEVSLEELQEGGFDIEGADGQDAKALIDAKHVVSVLKKIKEPYRSLLIMRYIDELKPAEISELTGETPNAVSVRLNRAVKFLRASLDNG